MSGVFHDKYEIAGALRETGLLLNVLGENPYEAKAYLQGAKAVENTSEDIGKLIREERLTELSGIGDSLASSITDLYKNGETALLSKLRMQLPQGALELSQIRGMTLARIKTLTDIGIDSKSKLEKACKSGKLAKVKGFGIKVQRSILDRLQSAGQTKSQTLLVDAQDIALEFLDDLKSSLKTQKVEIVGKIRRYYGVHSIEKMARAAIKMGKKYMTLTDHSPTAHYAGGLSIDRLKEQWEEIDRVQEMLNFKILKGTECDILADGRLDYPDHILEKFDVIIASIHSRYRQDEEAMTRRLLRGLKNPHFKIWGHPLGRLVLKRDPIPCDVEKILEAIADARVAIEINGDPYRLDLAPQWTRIARNLGLKFVISTDAHSTSNFQNLRYGIHLARRAGICKKDVLNTMSVQNFKKIVKPA